MGLLYLIVSIAAAMGGFYIARTFVRRRLRFVDAVYSPAALLPLVTGATAAVFGIGAGLGTASGVKALRSGQSG